MTQPQSQPQHSTPYQRSALPTQQQRPSPTPSHIYSHKANPSESPSVGPQTSPDATARKHKQQPPSTDPAIYSDAVRKGISNHSRTGQACDRCKVRKIRCDQAPDQCTNCRNQNLECLVTDRTTGRTVRRDYLRELERQMGALEASNRGLEQLLRKHAGIEVKPFEYNPVKAKLPVGHTVDDQGNIIPDPEWLAAGWIEDCGVYIRKPAQTILSNSSGLPLPLSSAATVKSESPQPAGPASRAFRLQSDLELARRPGLHIGMTTDLPGSQSTMMGRQLAVLGFAFNLADDTDPDVAEPDVVPDPSRHVYNKSVRSMLRTIHHLHPVPELELPTFEFANNYSQWYFLMIHQYLPIIHKPTYMALLKRFYEPGFVPTPAQAVQVHMVLSIIYYQIGTRNWEKPSERDTFVDLSNKHYHAALSKVPHLQMEPSFESVQAMTLICAHARSFPKPGAALHMSHLTLNMATDIGLHRTPYLASDKTTNLIYEMRKRVWWAIMVVVVTMCGRLGQPMPISSAEFDCPFPEAIPEECLLEDRVDMSLQKEPCHYVVGLAGYRVALLYLEMYQNLFAAKFDAAHYHDIIEALESKLDAWREWLPNEIRVGVPGPAEEDGKVSATYAHLFGLEFRLIMRHPAVYEAASEDIKNSNIKICRELSREILRYTMRLRDLKSLDTAFYQVSNYLLCLMTVLSAVHKERHKLSSQEYTEFKQEVEGWLSILQECWKLMGVNDSSLRPLVQLVSSGLDNNSQEPPMDQAALFRHVLKDIMDMKNEYQNSEGIPTRIGSNTTSGNLSHVPTSIAFGQFRGRDDRGINQLPNSSYTTNRLCSTQVLAIPGMVQPTASNGGAGAEQMKTGMVNDVTWFPVPPGLVRGANGLIMPMENLPHSITPAVTSVASTVRNILNSTDAAQNIPSSRVSAGHGTESWPLLVFDKGATQSSSQPMTDYNSADYRRNHATGASFDT